MSGVSVLAAPGGPSPQINYVDSQSTPYSLSGQLPPELALRQQQLNRRQQIANALLLQGTKMPQGQMVGGWYVPPSWAQNAAQLGQGIAGLAATYFNDKAEKDIGQDSQNQLAEAVANYKSQASPIPAVAPNEVPSGSEGPSTPGSPAVERTPEQQRQALIDLMANQHPQAQRLGSLLEAEQGKEDARKQAVAMALLQSQLKNQEPYNLGPGQSRFGAGGTPIASVAPNAIPVNAGNQTAFVNPQTGQPVGAPIPTGLSPDKAAQLAQPVPVNQGDKTTFVNPQTAQPVGQSLPTNVSPNALAGADAQAAIALQGHQDRVAQMAQNQKQDDATLQLRKDQGLSDQEYKKERLAMDQKHNDQTAQMAREKLAIEKTVHQEGKIPLGYEKVEGGLKAIPGGPADLKQQGMLNQDTGMLQSSNAAMDRLATSANEILKHPGLDSITGLRGAIPNIPGTNAADAAAKLATLKSQIGFGVLQEMRNNSKSGSSGLGAVSDAEGKRLESNLAALDQAQSGKQMRESLQKIVDYADQAKGRLRDAYNLKHKTGEPAAAAPSAIPGPVAPFTDAEKEARYQEWKKSHQ